MKKLGQKLSFLTKILLVVGLLISNLSSLSIVFAYEVSDDLIIELKDNVLEISYTEQLAEEVESVNVKVYENYAYSDDLSEKEVVTSYSLTAEQLLDAKEGILELTHNSIFDNGDEVVTNFEIFDGTYSVKVEIIDVTVYEEEILEETSSEAENATEIIEVVDITTETNNEEVAEVVGTVISSNTYVKEMSHDSGLNIKLFDATTNEEITLVDGKYPVAMDSTKVKVVAQILSGGLEPNDVFEYNNEEFKANEIINIEFSTEVDFNGHLYGEYEIPVEVKVLKQLPVTEEASLSEVNAVTETSSEVVETIEVSEQYEEVVYVDSINVLYGSYEANAAVLNDVTLSLGYGEAYWFYSEEKDGNLYVFSGFEEEVTSEVETVAEEGIAVTKTMLDLYNIMKNAIGENNEESPITYTLVKNGINVLEVYDETAGVSLEDYLTTIVLDDTVIATISNDGLSITYNVVIIADLNDDSLLTEEDLLELIDQTIGASEITDISKSDLVIDEKVDTLDVLYLNQVIDSKSWDVYELSVEATLDANLNVLFNDTGLSEENYLTSGDEFTVDYVLSLTDYDVNGVAGLFDYDKTLFELVSLKVNYDWIGNNHDGKFLYLGGEVLTKPELEETTPETETPEIEENTSLEVENEIDPEETENEIVTNDYVVVTATFKALKATSEESNNVITLKGIELFNATDELVTYYLLDTNTVSTEAIEVTASSDNTLSYLEVAGVKIILEDGVYEYEIKVDNEVTAVDLKYILNNVAASVTSEVYPEELAEGSNSIVVTVTSESGVSQSYTITVVREETPEVTTQVNNNYYYDNNTDDDVNDNEVVVNPGIEDDGEDDKDEEKDGNLSRIIIIILILIVIAGLVYLIFKEDDDDETKKANKDINKLKKAPIEPEVKETVKTTTKSVAKTAAAGKTASKTTSKSSSSKNKGSKDKNKER